MITIFCCPKPFDVRSGGLQVNAISSWLRLKPRPEVILCGDEDGTSEVCRSLGLKHVPEVCSTSAGTPYVSGVFEAGQAAASADICCYINADIILLANFMASVKTIAGRYKSFLIVGQRTNLDVTHPIEFDDVAAVEELEMRAQLNGEAAGPGALDYFVFRRGLYCDIPPFCLGRFYWDNYLIWHAAAQGATLVDCSANITAIHQNHEYNQCKRGLNGILDSQEYRANKQLFGSRRWPIRTDDAPYVMEGFRVRRRWFRIPLIRLHRCCRTNRIYAASWDFLRSIGRTSSPVADGRVR